MTLNEYGELLYLLEIITSIAIPILLISIYKISKNKGIFFIILLFFSELAIMQLRVYDVSLIMIYVLI